MGDRALLLPGLRQAQAGPRDGARPRQLEAGAPAPAPARQRRGERRGVRVGFGALQLRRVDGEPAREPPRRAAALDPGLLRRRQLPVLPDLVHAAPRRGWRLPGRHRRGHAEVVNGASDEELLAAHLEGDRTAFGELMTRHERRIYGLCFRILGNREDAEDATQEAFRGEAAFSTWLYRIAVNAATDQARRRGRARTTPLEAEETGQGAAAVGDPGAVVATTLTVQAAMRAVPEDFRVALVLCDLYGFGHAQAAEILGIPVGTVK